MHSVSIVIPVGPNPVYKKWLPEALESAANQTYVGDIEVCLICDGAEITGEEFMALIRSIPIGDRSVIFADHPPTFYPPSQFIEADRIVRLYTIPCNIGFAPAFNLGVACASHDLIVYLAADDKLMPTAVADCVATWEQNGQRDAWYAMTYEVDGVLHDIPINAAMITKPLWQWLGGYPPSAFAGPDALLLSILYKHAPDRIIKVAQGKANYWVRTHPDQETTRQAAYFLAEMNSIRAKETARFKPKDGVILR